MNVRAAEGVASRGRHSPALVFGLARLSRARTVGGAGAVSHGGGAHPHPTRTHLLAPFTPCARSSPPAAAGCLRPSLGHWLPQQSDLPVARQPGSTSTRVKSSAVRKKRNSVIGPSCPPKTTPYVWQGPRYGRRVRAVRSLARSGLASIGCVGRGCVGRGCVGRGCVLAEGRLVEGLRSKGVGGACGCFGFWD
jgi:hypothetical protein